MFAFRMKSSNKLVHSLIDGKEHEHPCVCVCVRTNHRHCNVMRFVYDVRCVQWHNYMYSYSMMGTVCFAPHVFLFFILFTSHSFACVLACLLTLSHLVLTVSHTHDIPNFNHNCAMERATETQTESNRRKTHKIQFNLFSISH